MSQPQPQPQQPKGYGQASTIYRKAGWLGVLPLDPGTKWPPPPGFTGREGGFPDGKQVFAWVQQRALHGLALRLPRGTVGVDVDVYDSKHGDRTLAELEERYGPLPATWSSTSRGPGQPSRIHLFRCPEDLILPGAPGPAIEFIQHHHRYTVAWPTVVDGRQYRWYDPEGRAVARPPRLNELAWLPEDWHRIQKPRVTVTDYQPRAVSGDWSQAVARHHGEGVEALKTAGGRHDAMLPVVLSLVRADERGHPGAAEALADLHGRFVVAVGDRSSAKEAELEWGRMEDGAAALVASTPAQRPKHEELHARQLDWAQGRQEPPSQPIGDFEGDDEEQEADEKPVDVPDPLLSMLIQWDEFWNKDHSSEEWLAWPLVPAGRQVALYAPAKTGKSIVTLAVVAALATGGRVLGNPAQPAVDVLYLDYEMTESDLYERLEALGYGPGDDWTHLHYASLPSLPPLNTKEGASAVAHLAHLVGARLVVVDTTGRALDGDENDSGPYRDFARHTGDILKRMGIALLRTDHAGKDGTKGQRGSSAKADDVDVVFSLDAAQDGYSLRRTHTRVAWVPDRVALKRTVDDDGVLAFSAARGELFAAGTKGVADRLDAMGVPATAPRREAERQLREAGLKVSSKLVGDAQRYRRDRPLGGFENDGNQAGTKSYPQGQNQAGNHDEF